MKTDPLTLKTRLFLLSSIALILGIYSFPAIRTSIATGSQVLPAGFAPDVSLYLNISTIPTATSGQFVDPYYGAGIPNASMGYLKFRMAFLLLSYLITLLHGNLWWSLLLWNLFWWGALCALALWFFREFLPDRSLLIVLAGLAVLMLFNFGSLQSQLAAWVHLPSLLRFQDVQLAFIRPFFPQVPVPLLILYLGLQVKALQKRDWKLWAAMVATQFLAFTIFPYAMLMMAGITAVAVIGLFISRRPAVSWITLSLYAVACGACDMLFLLHGSETGRTGAPGQYSLIHLQFSVLPHRIGGIWLMLAGLTALVLLLRDLAPEVKWTLAGLGVSNLFLLLGDAFFSETTLQVSHHAGYFVHLTAAILFTFLLSAAVGIFANREPVWRFALLGLNAFLLLNGELLAQATYRAALPANERQAELVRVLQSDPPQASDLVIARSLVVDDDCGWVPLITRSHVLFCRSAQVLLSPEQNGEIQRERQAFYLYFTGKDAAWVEGILQNPRAEAELARLTFLGQVTTDVAERQEGIDSVRNQLLPILTKVQDGDPAMRSFFSRYRRILVVDEMANPYFVESRLAAYLRVETRQALGNRLILHCSSALP